MGVVTEDAIKALAAFKGREAPVVSVYLEVDGRRNPRRQDYENTLQRLLRPHRADPTVSGDLDRIETYVRAGIDRSHTRGLAIFSCERHDFWHALHLAVPVHSQLVVNHTPHLRQLEAVLSNNERFGVLLVDRQRARIFVFDQGELIDHSEAFDQLPRHDDDRGDWRRDHVRDHVEAAVHAHIRRAAHAMFAVHQHHHIDHLILAAPAELASEAERELHTYLRERIAARVSLPTSAGVAEIQRLALELDADVERRKEAALVQRLREHLGGRASAVAGLEPVLAALSERRVDTLLVSEGFEAPGWRCWDCSQVAAKGARCPACAASMSRVDDVVEEAVEVALGQSCRVVSCVGNADLDVLGRIGALLRF